MRQFRSIQGRIIEEVPVTAEMDNFEEIVSRLRDRNTQLLYLPIDSKSVIEISRALENIGWNTQVMGSDGLLTNVQ